MNTQHFLWLFWEEAKKIKKKNNKKKLKEERVKLKKRKFGIRKTENNNKNCWQKHKGEKLLHIQIKKSA